MTLSLDTVWRRWWKTPDGVADSQAHAEPAAALAESPWLDRLDESKIPRHLIYPSTTLGRILDQSADRFGDAEAMLYNHHRWTYRELLAAVNRMAGGLAHLGVRRGERVLMVLPNCPEFVIVFFAVQKLGAIVVNAGPLMGRDDLQTIIGMTNPRVAVGLDLQAANLHWACRGSAVEHLVYVSLQTYQPVLKRLGYQMKLWQTRDTAGVNGVQHILLTNLLSRAPARPPTVEADPNAVAVLQATGGTTGTLKLAQLTHRSLLANAMQVSVWEGCAQGQERVFAVLPMFHVYGLTTCLISSVFSASAMILMTRFNAPEMLELIRRHKPTICPIVPAICDAISDLLEKEQQKDAGAPSPLNGLRLCISGAAPLPRETAERFNRLTGATVVEGYGLTEASPVTHAGLPGRERTGSIGLPLPDTQARIVDLDDPTRDVPVGEPGEMLIAGPQIMSGYFANPEQTHNALLTDPHGVVWLRTGDVARMDRDGFFYVLDRKKDMIIRAGMKVYPAKVERVLRMHQRVGDVAVVGRPDPHHTEMVVAVIAPAIATAEQGKLVEELRSLCREHLAPYEVPQLFEFIEQLPRSPLGKLLKRELRKGSTGGSGASDAKTALPDFTGAAAGESTAANGSEVRGLQDAQSDQGALGPRVASGVSGPQMHSRDAERSTPENAGPIVGRAGTANGNGHYGH